MEQKLTEMHEQLVNGLGTVISRLDGLEQGQQGVVERVTQLEELKPSPGGDTSIPALDESLDPFANIDLNDQVDKKSSSRKSRSRRSFLAQEHEEYVSQEQEDEPSDDDTDDIMTEVRIAAGRYVGLIKSNVEKHSGKEEDHEQWLGTLQSEFRLNGFKHIISDQEKVWQNCKQKKPKQANLQNRVMISVLNGTIKSGTVYSKFQSARTDRPLDGRGMYIATKEAHHSASYRNTRRKLKRKLKDLQYDQQEDY